MSDTMTRIDALQELAGWTRRLGGMYMKDLNALSDEAYVTSPGGAARAPYAFTAEVTGICGIATAMINGVTPEMPSEEAIAAASEPFKSKAFALEAFEKSVNALADAVSSSTDEAMSKMVTAPWGEPMSLFQFASITANHIWYHDGQLNVVQALHGDGAIHWMD